MVNRVTTAGRVPWRSLGGLFILMLPLAVAAGVHPAFGQTEVGVSIDSVSYDAAAYGRRVTLKLSYYVGFPLNEQCAIQDAENVVLTDRLPDGATLVSETRGDGVFDSTSNSVTWNLGTLNRCATYGNSISMVADVAPTVPDGASVVDFLSITTTTPETDTTNDLASSTFTVGFLPLGVTVDPGTTYCQTEARGDTISISNNHSLDGVPVGCSSVGSGGSASASSDRVSLSPSGPGPFLGQISSGRDMLTISGVGVAAQALGYGGQGHGSASAEVSVIVQISVFNPNPYAVGLHLIRDTSLYAAAGNESARPPFPGDAYVEDTGGSVEAGSGVATDAVTQHVDASPAGCRVRRAEFSTRFPAVPGPDPRLDPLEPDISSATDDLFPGSSCFGGSIIKASSGRTFSLAFGSDFSEGETSATDTDGDGFRDLLRSGYGLFNASTRLEIRRADGPVVSRVATLAVTGNSPIDLLITDPSGRRLGFDQPNAKVIDEIFGGQYNGHGAEPQKAFIPSPSVGTYDVQVIGTGSGPFTLTLQSLDADGSVLGTQVYTGTASEGSQDSFQTDLGSSGALNPTTPGGGDSQAPTSTAALSPLPNAAGWNRSDVTVNISADDAGGSGVKEIVYSASGAQNIPSTSVDGSAASVTITSEGETTIQFFAKDNAGNVETARSITVRLDKTAPSIACGSADGIWHGADVILTCAAGDAGSNLAAASDAAFALSTAVPEGVETADAVTNSHIVCDVAGNCATAGPVGGNRVDRKPPSILIATPIATQYLLNQLVSASYSCSDGGSGVASCTGPVDDGQNIDTSSTGTKVFEVLAGDSVGNAAQQDLDYTVTYNTCLLYDPTKAAKSGSTLPVKFQLCDVSGMNSSSPGITVIALSVMLESTSAPGVLQDSGNANPDFNFRYDSSLGGTGGYIFNLSTKELGTGTYQLLFRAGDDPVVHSLRFQVK